ncbi:helix-turn-helix domain-containing protein [Chitinophaga japonensis]|uniref:AraC-like DNA-binding protein n=1 Tax=Chitinophaga japonensis TaxID=104662 RepID=A0A562T1H7_CHIJA|nr:helix-turn-helix domain-containing protein [Chitinophaga japonensis]TWI86740.1 AraC-like DNA-binding protein [Chitinophaga japonensis]
MQYKQIPPPAFLQDYVRYFWVLENDGDDGLPRNLRAIADGSPGLIFQQTDCGTLCYEDRNRLPGMFLYGQTTKPRNMYATGKLCTIGIYFYPNALKSVFGLNANELTDDCLDLHSLNASQVISLSDQLLNTLSIQERIRALSSYLVTQVQAHNIPVDEPMRYAVSQIVQSKGHVSVKELREQLFLTERSFERRFKQWVGIPPKLFARICQFQASLAQLRHNRFDKLSDIAFELDYADHSHYIRAFKEFAGFSPNQYQKWSSEVVENLAEVRR